MKLKEFLQTPDEIVDVFKGLIFSKDDKQSLFDGSTKEMVVVDVLKENNVLLFISSLNISSDDISILIPIYIGIRKKKYKFKIVWIPIVEQWTYELQKKFKMLQSDMPWYIVEYFSPIAGIKFIKEEWHFDNKPIVVELNSQGDVKNKGGLYMMPQVKVDGLVAGRAWMTFLQKAAFRNPRGPHEIEVCTFYCGGTDKRWIKQFCEKFNAVAKDPLIDEDGNRCVALFYVGEDCKLQRSDENIRELLRPFKLQHLDVEIQVLLRPFKKKSRWAVFMNGFNEVISNDETTIVTFLEGFGQWKGKVRRRRRIETCFKDLLQTASLPSTSMNV